jgi:uncharacterized membrane protein
VLFDINNRGQIIGGYVDAGGMRQSFLLDDGVFTTFAVPGASRTAAFDIDDRGRIVGFFVDAVGPGHGFLLDKGAFTTIDVPGDSEPGRPRSSASTTAARWWASTSMPGESSRGF